MQRARRIVHVLSGRAVPSGIRSRVTVVPGVGDRGARDPAGCQHHARRQHDDSFLHLVVLLLKVREPTALLVAACRQEGQPVLPGARKLGGASVLRQPSAYGPEGQHARCRE